MSAAAARTTEDPRIELLVAAQAQTHRDVAALVRTVERGQAEAKEHFAAILSAHAALEQRLTLEVGKIDRRFDALEASHQRLQELRSAPEGG